MNSITSEAAKELEDVERKEELAKAEKNENLKIPFPKDSWVTLAECTMLTIMVLNRKRPGDIQRTYLEDCENLSSINPDSGDYKELSESEKIYADIYSIIRSLGKLRKSVRIIISKYLIDRIRLLNRWRLRAGISSKNPYLFTYAKTIEGEYSTFEASALMRKYAPQSGVKHPNRFRATELRKHLATYASKKSCHQKK